MVKVRDYDWYEEVEEELKVKHVCPKCGGDLITIMVFKDKILKMCINNKCTEKVFFKK